MNKDTKQKSDHTTTSAALDYLQIGYIVTDIDHNVLVLNNAARDLLLETKLITTLEQVVAKLPERLQLLDHVKYCSVEHKSCSFQEVEIGERKVRLFLSPIFEDGDLTGNLITLEDITEAVDKQKTRDQFLAFLVHEFRTPLTAIKGNASLLGEYFGDELMNKNLDDVLEDITEGSKHLLQMVNQFLDMSRLEEGRIQYKLQEFDACQVVSSTVQSLQVIAADHGLQPIYEQPEPADITVVADPERTVQVLTNLLGNALKFTEKGSVTISLQAQDEYLRISVTDTGPGIPEDSRGNMFQKYFQASNNKFSTDSSKSSGIGLYISRLITEGMGGRIALERSEVGAGSTFTFDLTLATPARLRQMVKLQNDAVQGVEHAQVAEHNILAV